MLYIKTYNVDGRITWSCFFFIIFARTETMRRMEHPFNRFKYCPKCGSTHPETHNEKSEQCTDCGFIYYFNPSSTAVTLIPDKQDELLVYHYTKKPTKGILGLPGGFIDTSETGEGGVTREVEGEAGLKVKKATYLFSLPNIYIYSEFPVYTLDILFLCQVENTGHFETMDDVADSFFVLLSQINPEEFGLGSVKGGLKRFLKER